MPSDISEKGLETILVSYLRDHQGYEEGISSDYDKDFGLDTQRVKRFLTSSLRHPKILIKEFCYFLMPCHQHGLRINLLV